jgi:hypothetical protein
MSCITTTTTAPCISVIYDICSCKSHHHMITITTAPCISVIHDICVVVIIWLCDLPLHMSCIAEIHVAAVVVVIIWWCDLSCKSHHHMITTTTAATCISAIHDICSCKSNNHMITTKMAPCISVMVV